MQASNTVLLVEDEPRVAALVASALKKAGYVVLQASDAAQALEIVRTHAGPIDLLLTDVVMPGMNGRQLADEVTLHPSRDSRALHVRIFRRCGAEARGPDRVGALHSEAVFDSCPDRKNP